MPRAKAFLANLLVFLAALALSLVAAEFVVRLLLKDQTVLFPRYHTDYHYGKYTLRGVRPNSDFWYTSVDGHWHFVTDSHGFRDRRDFSYAKPSGTVRILSLGDSHTFGIEVRQDATFSAVSERYLDEHGVSAQVINTGVSGFGTAEELALLENEGYKYAPDVVVVGFYANDFEDNFKSGLFALDAKDQLVAKRYVHIPGVRIQNFIYRIPGVKWLGENSYFYSLLFNTVWETAKMALTRAAERQAASAGSGAQALPAVDSTEYAVPTQSSVPESEIRLAAALLERMQRFCAAKGIRLIVVDIPTRAAERRTASSLPPALRARLAQAGIEVLPSEALLAPYQGIVEMHVPHGDQHISEFTHALIGVEIAKRVLAALPPGVHPRPDLVARAPSR